VAGRPQRPGRGGSRARPDSGSNDGMTSDPATISKAVQVSVNGVTADLPVTPGLDWLIHPGQGPGPHHADRDLAVPEARKSSGRFYAASVVSPSADTLYSTALPPG
jgi:hypothetical protein